MADANAIAVSSPPNDLRLITSTSNIDSRLKGTLDQESTRERRAAMQKNAVDGLPQGGVGLRRSVEHALGGLQLDDDNAFVPS